MIPIRIFLVLIIFILSSCSSKENNLNNFASEKSLIERLQLDTQKLFEESQKTYYSIKEIQYDYSNQSLALSANRQIKMADKIDGSISEIISLIEELKWKLIKDNNRKNSLNSKNVIQPYEYYFPTRPSIIDINYYDFVTNELRPSTFNTSINKLKVRIELLRKEIKQKTFQYYDLPKMSNNENNTDSNIESFKYEFKFRDLAYRKTDINACGKGEVGRINQIEIELLPNKKYWESSFATHTSSSLLFCHLVNLQNNILIVRNMLFELIYFNLICEFRKMNI